MRISRELIIKILKYLNKYPNFYFPFLVMCKEYTPEDDDFVEIEPEEQELIKDDEFYQTFEIRENLQHIYKNTTKLLAKWFLEKIVWESLYKEINSRARQYRKLYKEELWESEKIEEFWGNEFFDEKQKHMKMF